MTWLSANADRSTKYGEEPAIAWRALLVSAEQGLEEGEDKQTERLCLRALAHAEKCFGAQDLRVAQSLVVLAEICERANRHTEAKALYEHSCKILKEKALKISILEIGLKNE